MQIGAPAVPSCAVIVYENVPPTYDKFAGRKSCTIKSSNTVRLLLFTTTVYCSGSTRCRPEIAFGKCDLLQSEIGVTGSFIIGLRPRQNIFINSLRIRIIAVFQMV